MVNLKVIQIRSLIGRPERQRRIIRGLGLKRINHSVIRPDTDVVRGMIFKVKHMVRVEETDEQVPPSKRRKKALSTEG